MTISCLHF